MVQHLHCSTIGKYYKLELYFHSHTSFSPSLQSQLQTFVSIPLTFNNIPLSLILMTWNKIYFSINIHTHTHTQIKDNMYLHMPYTSRGKYYQFSFLPICGCHFRLCIDPIANKLLPCDERWLENFQKKQTTSLSCSFQIHPKISFISSKFVPYLCIQFCG